MAASEEERKEHTDAEPEETALSVHGNTTWMWGGALLIASGLLRTGLNTVPYINIPSALLFAASLVIFALGIRGQGSIVQRRSLGVTALIGLAVLTLLRRVQGNLFGILPHDLLTTISLITLVVQGTFALVAVVQIARVAAVPRPWNTAPGWVFAGLVVINALEAVFTQLYATLNGSGPETQGVLYAISSVLGFANVIAPMLLGVFAVILAGRKASSGPRIRG